MLMFFAGAVVIYFLILLFAALLVLTAPAIADADFVTDVFFCCCFLFC